MSDLNTEHLTTAATTAASKEEEQQQKQLNDFISHYKKVPLPLEYFVQLANQGVNTGLRHSMYRRSCSFFVILLFFLLLPFCLLS